MFFRRKCNDQGVTLFCKDSLCCCLLVADVGSKMRMRSSSNEDVEDGRGWETGYHGEPLVWKVGTILGSVARENPFEKEISELTAE
jgi:hypothetical protein